MVRNTICLLSSCCSRISAESSVARSESTVCASMRERVEGDREREALLDLRPYRRRRCDAVAESASCSRVLRLRHRRGRRDCPLPSTGESGVDLLELTREAVVRHVHATHVSRGAPYMTNTLITSITPSSAMTTQPSAVPAPSRMAK